MKKYLFLQTVLLILTVSGSCKKETAAAAKDYTFSVSDRTWWGMAEVSGAGNEECFSVHFNADHSLVWSVAAGDETGKWSVEGDKIAFNHGNPAVAVTAVISGDNQLGQVTVSNNRGLHRVALISSPYAALDNTTWRGQVGNPAQTLQLDFLPNAVLAMKVGGADQGKASYTRASSGGFIRYTIAGNDFFGVFAADGQLVGLVRYMGTSGPWQAAK